MSLIKSQLFLAFLLVTILPSNVLAEKRADESSEVISIDEKSLVTSVTQFLDGDHALTQSLITRAEMFFELGYLTFLASQPKNAQESMDCGAQKGELSSGCRALIDNIKSSKAELERLPVPGVLTGKLKAIMMGLAPLPSPTPVVPTTTTPTPSPTPTVTPTPPSRFRFDEFYCATRDSQANGTRPSLPLPRWFTESESNTDREGADDRYDITPRDLTATLSTPLPAYNGPMSSSGVSGTQSSPLSVDTGSASSSETSPTIPGIFYEFSQDQHSLHIEAGKYWIGSGTGVTLVDRFVGDFSKENPTDFRVNYGWGLKFPIGKFDIMCTLGVFVGDN